MSTNVIYILYVYIYHISKYLKKNNVKFIIVTFVNRCIVHKRTINLIEFAFAFYIYVTFPRLLCKLNFIVRKWKRFLWLANSWKKNTQFGLIYYYRIVCWLLLLLILFLHRLFDLFHLHSNKSIFIVLMHVNANPLNM